MTNMKWRVEVYYSKFLREGWTYRARACYITAHATTELDRIADNYTTATAAKRAWKRWAKAQGISKWKFV